MHRDALRRMLEDRGVLMPDWPVVQFGWFLVVDEWGCSAEVFRDTDAKWAIEQWAKDIEETGGWGGSPHPQGDVVYAIDYYGEVTAHRLFTEYDPSFFTRDGELPIPKGLVWC